jgi:hypothetical protein
MMNENEAAFEEALPVEPEMADAQENTPEPLPPVVRYVTFRKDGTLSGSYLQAILPEHAECAIEVDEATAENWLAYRVNEARDGLEELPPDSPKPDPLAESIPMLNLQLVLIEDGKLEEAEAAIAAFPGADGQRARAYWNRAMTARLDNDLVQALWPQLYDTQEAFLAAWARGAAMNP